MGGNGAKSATAKKERAAKTAKWFSEYKVARRKLSASNGAAKRARSSYLEQKAMPRALDKHLQKVGNKDYQREFEKLTKVRKSYAKTLTKQKKAQREYDKLMKNKPR